MILYEIVSPTQLCTIRACLFIQFVCLILVLVLAPKAVYYSADRNRLGIVALVWSWSCLIIDLVLHSSLSLVFKGKCQQSHNFAKLSPNSSFAGLV